MNSAPDFIEGQFHSADLLNLAFLWAILQFLWQRSTSSLRCAVKCRLEGAGGKDHRNAWAKD